MGKRGGISVSTILFLERLKKGKYKIVGTVKKVKEIEEDVCPDGDVDADVAAEHASTGE
jgi:hypothetical protein